MRNNSLFEDDDFKWSFICGLVSFILWATILFYFFKYGDIFAIVSHGEGGAGTFIFGFIYIVNFYLTTKFIHNVLNKMNDSSFYGNGTTEYTVKYDSDTNRATVSSSEGGYYDFDFLFWFAYIFFWFTLPIIGLPFFIIYFIIKKEKRKIKYSVFHEAKYKRKRDNFYEKLLEIKGKPRERISFVIHSDTKRIANRVFLGCYNLKTITIGKNIRRIGKFAFKGCIKLTSITFEGTATQWKAIKKGHRWDFDVPATQVHCSDGDVNL